MDSILDSHYGKKYMCVYLTYLWMNRKTFATNLVR